MRAFDQALVGLAVVIASACSADDGENQATCPGDIAARAAALPDWPTPLAPGLEGPVVLESDGLLVDPDPTTRGEHVVFAIDERGCDLALRRLPALPITRGASQQIIGAVESDRKRAGLVLMGADVADDTPIWGDVLATLDVHARALTAPSQADAEAAIATTCEAIEAGGLLVLVVAGQGTPGEGGALVLSAIDGETPEVMSYRRVAQLLTEHCAHTAIVWFVDASHFALEVSGAAPTLPPAGPPLLILRASDRSAVDAARASRHGPGLLATVLSDVLPVRRAELCAPNRLENPEIMALLREFELNRALRAALLDARWRAFGEPAIARLEAAGLLTPNASEQLRTTLSSAIPHEPILVRGTLPSGERCRTAAECDMCELNACQWAVCSNGFCRARPHDGGGCDDGNDCTRGDRCNGGECRGELLACDDGNPCTDEACEPGHGCVADPARGRACDDGDPCTTADACNDVGACVGAGRVCDDGDACTFDTCTSTRGCVFEARNLPCDDGDPCTLVDQCRSQVCSGTRRTCTDGNDCTVDRCDAATGECRFDPIAELVGCDDGDPCTTLDRCRDGVCTGLAATCDDGLTCTFDRCEEGACRHLPAPGLCLTPSGSACVAVGEQPADAPCLVCEATDRLVPTREGLGCESDGLDCTVDQCEGGACTHRDAADACHAPAASGPAACVAIGERVTPCLVCQGAGVVTALPSGAACSCPDAVESSGGACDGIGNCRCD